MIHYHGSPLTPEAAAAVAYQGRHAMVSFAHPEQLPLIADVCHTWALDNGAFSAWRSGKPITDWEPFYAWVEKWSKHPGFDWFLIPDVIDGSEADNDALIADCTNPRQGVPIWHLHESLERLESLSYSWPRIAFGSSGEFAEIKTDRWWHRMSEAMGVCCDENGRPICKLHGLRMLDPRVFTCFPFSSCDSTNMARNVGYDGRWHGVYEPPSKGTRGISIAWTIEAHNSAPIWRREELEMQHVLFD